MEEHCTLLINKSSKAPDLQAKDLAKMIESDKDADKISALQSVITLMLGGEDLSSLLMTVIRFCITTENHVLKKLLQLFWEVCPKYAQDGTLKPEMILVCNALRNDLNHPNEYIRGCCLRFLCKLSEPELLDPLVASVKINLNHHSVYVRRNAVITMLSIYRNFPDTLIPDAPELVEQLLLKETDAGVRRNAFLMLFQTAQDKAVDYLLNNLEQISTYGDGFRLVVLELVRKVCREDPSQKGLFIKPIFAMLNSDSAAVCFEASSTLVSLSAAPTAVRAAASTYTRLLTTHSDSNVKLVLLDRIDKLKKYHSKILSELLLEMLRVLSSRNIDIRKKTLAIAMDLINSRNIEEVMLVLKKEVQKTNDESESESAIEYRGLLIQAIHICAVKFPDVAHSVVHLLMDFLSADGAIDVIRFVREIVEKYPSLRESVLKKLILMLPFITNSDVLRVALWVLGDYCDTNETISIAVEAIKGALGPMPLANPMKPEDAAKAADAKAVPAAAAVVPKGPKVLADGSYATQSAADPALVKRAAITIDDSTPILRKLIAGGDFYLASALGATMTKLTLRLMAIAGPTADVAKALVIDTLLVITGIVNFGQGPFSPRVIESDSVDRLTLCARCLLDPAVAEGMLPIWLKGCREAFVHLLAVQRKDAASGGDKGKEPVKLIVEPDNLISFRQLRPKRGTMDIGELDFDDAADISKATEINILNDFSEKLNRTFQLTGSADPVYCEAHVKNHEYDILLDILIINRTSVNLTNLTVELATMGPLKLVERPQSYTLAAGESVRTKATIKVSSTETSNIFGNIVFDSSTSAGTTVINLRDINIDIMDYIRPAPSSDVLFRGMWAEFEWENKVVVNTEIATVVDYVNNIVRLTKMSCLKPLSNLGDCNFLAANLYAKSIFGEDALLNVSVATSDAGKVEGYIRIRSKTQGIALSLGERISAKQKSIPVESA